MKKRAFAFVCFLALSMMAHAANVTFTWDYDYSADFACTSAQPVNCVSGFTGYYLNATGTRVVIFNVANPQTAGTSYFTGISTTASLAKKYGNTTVYVVALGKDDTGAVIESAPANATVSLRPGSPQKLSAN